MKCENCGADFAPLTVTQRYCCDKCGDRYRRKHPEAAKRHFPSVTFNCSQCGKTVTTDGVRDMRTRFCSRECEKKFWRHPHWESPYSNQTFGSVQHYTAYEKSQLAE